MSKDFKINLLFVLMSVSFIFAVMGTVFYFLSNRDYESQEVSLQDQSVAAEAEEDMLVNAESNGSNEEINSAEILDCNNDFIENDNVSCSLLDAYVGGNEEETASNTNVAVVNQANNTKPTNNDLEQPTIVDNTDNQAVISRPYLLMMKDVGEPYMNRFGLGPGDYKKMKEAGVDIIESNFDTCASNSDVLIFLEGAKDAGLKVIMPAGAGEAEWGYPCDDNYDEDQKPEWQKDRVQAWVKKWSYHPAIYAWDISNEAGQNFPNAQRYDDDWVNHNQAIVLSQLQTAYKDVKAVDPSRPIMIRMNGWYFYDYDSNFFRTGNPFGPGVADIVMVNAYSNVDEYFSDLVWVVASRTESSVRKVSPKTKIIVALGAWEEPPMWVKPTIGQFTNDATMAKQVNNLLGIGIFKYGAEDSEWWMPEDAPSLWGKLTEIFPL